MTGVEQAIRDAAAVILLRPGDLGELEVFLLRRHRHASFMSSAFVFPGGAVDPGEDDLRITAARELFEEAGVLLATPGDLAPEVLAGLRRQLHEGQAWSNLLEQHKRRLALDQLHYFAHWITPSVERKRFSARFYVAELPAGQTPSFDNRETVEELWIRPAEALAAATELRLPPPQVRILRELAPAAKRGWPEVLALCAERAAAPHAILPRMRPLDDGGFALLLPWDPEYDSHGTGDSHPMPCDHPLATGPSRFIFKDQTWHNVSAPPLATAD